MLSLFLCSQENAFSQFFFLKQRCFAIVSRTEYKSYKTGFIDKLDAAYVKELLTSTGNNVQEASKSGGLERAQIYRLLKKGKTDFQ